MFAELDKIPHAQRRFLLPDPSHFNTRLCLIQPSTVVNTVYGGTDPDIFTRHETWAAWEQGTTSKEIFDDESLLEIETALIVVPYASHLQSLDADWQVGVPNTQGSETVWDIRGVQWPFGNNAYPLISIMRSSKAKKLG